MRDRRATVSATVLALVVAVPPLLAAALGTGEPTNLLPLSAGAAWLASPDRGLVTLVDGASERVIGSLRPGAPGADLSVVQAGTSAYAVDGSEGTVTRLDGATHGTTGPVRFAPEGTAPVVRRSDPLAAALIGHEAADDVHVVDPVRGTARLVDPVTLVPRAELPLSAHPGVGQSIVDGSGRLWLVDAESGGLSWADRDEKGVRQDLVDRHARLTVMRGEPVVVDVTGGRAGVLTDDGDVSWSGFDLPADPDLQVLGASTRLEVYAVVPSTGTLLWADLGTGDWRSVVTLGDPSDDLGTVVQDDRFLFVPNRTDGTAVIVDLADRRVVGTPVLAGPGSALELVAQGPYVFYNDLGSGLAGVLHLDGSGRWVAGEPLEKYGAEGDDGELLTPVDNGDARAPDDDVADTGTDPAEPSAEPSADPSVDPGDPGDPGDPEESAVQPTRTAPPTGARPPQARPLSGGTGSRTAGAGGGGPAPDPAPSDPPATSSPSPDDPSTAEPPTSQRPAPEITGLEAAPGTAVPGTTLTVTATVTDAVGATWDWSASVGSEQIGSGATPGGFTVDVPSDVSGPIDVTVTVSVGSGQDSEGLQVPVSSAATVSVSCSPDEAGLGQRVGCSGDVQGGTVPAATWRWTVSGPGVDGTEELAAGEPFDAGAFDSTGSYTVSLTVGTGALARSAEDTGAVADTCRFTAAQGEDIDFGTVTTTINNRRFTDAPFIGCFLPEQQTPVTSTATWLERRENFPDRVDPATGTGVARLGVYLTGFSFTDGRNHSAVMAILPNGHRMTWDVLTNLPPTVGALGGCWIWSPGDERAQFSGYFNDGDPMAASGTITLRPSGATFPATPRVLSGGPNMAGTASPTEIPTDTTSWELTVTDASGATATGGGGSMRGGNPGGPDCL